MRATSKTTTDQHRNRGRRTADRQAPDFTVCPFGRCGPLDPGRAAESSPAYSPQRRPDRRIVEIKATR